MTSQSRSSQHVVRPPNPGRPVVPPAGGTRAAWGLAGFLALLSIVTFFARDDLYASVAAAASGSVLEAVVGMVAEVGALALVGTAALLAAWSWFRDRRAFLTLSSAGIGVVGAYATSELIKLLVQEQRPCRALDVQTVLACPAVGDWSWPSNHGTIAAAFAAACFFTFPRSAWFVTPIAALIAASRVAAGVHYVHDVLAGVALGMLGVTIAVAIMRPVCDRLFYRAPFRQL
jgi:membrane-associated phospholipid phosphatase